MEGNILIHPVFFDPKLLKIDYVKAINGTPAFQYARHVEDELAQKDLIDQDQFYTSWDHQALTAMYNGNIVGIITFRDSEWDNTVYVVLGYVNSDMRRCGVYKSLWLELVKKAGELKRRRIVGGTNIKNIDMQKVMSILGRKLRTYVYVFMVPGQ